jgi:hypothetical protein
MVRKSTLILGFLYLVTVALGFLASYQPVLVIASFLAFLGLLSCGYFLSKPARILLVFLALLPLYQISLVLIMHITGSQTLVKALQPWKEVLALLVVVSVTGFYLRSSRWYKWNRLDWLVFLYLSLNIIYLFGPWQATLVTRLYGVRANAFLCVLYFLGRSIPLSSRRQTQVVTGFLILGLLSGIFALVDLFILPKDWPYRIGLTDYLIANFSSTNQGAQTMGGIGPMGLPWTYWTAAGQRRASAFFANPLDLAASIHFLGCAALIVALQAPPHSKKRWLISGIFFLATIGVLLSVSRASILTFALDCILITWFLRKRSMTVIIIGLCLLGLVAILASSSSLATFAWQTITFENPSSQGHLQEWSEGFRAMLQQPLGYGPGSSGSVGSRFGQKIGGENQYVILGVEIGFPGLFLYIAMQLLGIWTALWVFRHTTGITQTLALITAISRIGLGIVGMTSTIEIYVFQMYISWWLLGFMSQVYSKRRLEMRQAVAVVATSPMFETTSSSL